MKGLVISFLLVFSSLVMADDREITNPLDYAKSVARDFSLGDSNIEGTYFCQNNFDDEVEVGGNIQIIDCEGRRDVLVHGGEMSNVAFECRFNLEPTDLSEKYWEVTYENCQ